MNESAFARLFYLSKALHLKIPSRISSFLEGSQWINSVNTLTDPRYPQLTDRSLELFNMGAQFGPPSEPEWRELIKALLETREPPLDADSWFRVFEELKSSESAVRLEETIVPLNDVKGDETFQLFSSGFLPLDAVLGGGLSPGICTFIGAPGSGKSSLMLMIAEALTRVLPHSSPITLIQTEVPVQVFKARMAPIARRTTFRPIDMLICAPWTSGDLINYLADDPNPERIVIYDSPDPILLASSEESARFMIAKAWLDFVRIKQSLAKSILVTSWPRRGERNLLGLESGAEGAAKERYSDVVIGISPEGPRRTRFDCFKNRMGVADLRYSFGINWGSLVLEL